MTLINDLPDDKALALPDWLRASWDSAVQTGTDRLSAIDIDAEIAAARHARREA